MPILHASYVHLPPGPGQTSTPPQQKQEHLQPTEPLPMLPLSLEPPYLIYPTYIKPQDRPPKLISMTGRPAEPPPKLLLKPADHSYPSSNFHTTLLPYPPSILLHPSSLIHPTSIYLIH